MISHLRQDPDFVAEAFIPRVGAETTAFCTTVSLPRAEDRAAERIGKWMIYGNMPTLSDPFGAL